jgi:glucose-1-phosphate thymidylyltransferase
MVAGMHLAYLMMNLSFGVPYTVDQAYPFVKEVRVAFGFPDILFESKDAFSKLIARQVQMDADIVLGLFLAPQRHRVDMVQVEPRDGWVLAIHTKPLDTQLRYTWAIAVWTPVFTHFTHAYLQKAVYDQGGCGNLGDGSSEDELTMGDVIRAAIEADLKVNTVCFPEETCLDVGTPGNLLEAIRQNILPGYRSLAKY